MTEIKRFEPIVNCSEPDMREDANGDYVLHEDHIAALEAATKERDEALSSYAKASLDWRDASVVASPALRAAHEEALHAAADACPLNYFTKLTTRGGGAQYIRSGISSDDFDIMLVAYLEARG